MLHLALGNKKGKPPALMKTTDLSLENVWVVAPESASDCALLARQRKKRGKKRKWVSRERLSTASSMINVFHQQRKHSTRTMNSSVFESSNPCPRGLFMIGSDVLVADNDATCVAESVSKVCHPNIIVMGCKLL